MKIVTEELLKKWRRDLHQIPELAFEEYKTTRYIKSVLDSYGIKYYSPLETGAVVVFKSKKNTKDTVLFRADIDALPILEENEVSFKSNHEGKMHACGHDGHTTMILGAVIEAAEKYRNEEIGYNSIFVFQPSEECGGGGEVLINNFDFSNFNILASYALHMNPDFVEKSIISKNNEIMASATEYRIMIKGEAAHVGMKHRGVDALNVATMLYQELLKITALSTRSRDTNIVHIGKMWGGDAVNVVADEAHLEGTIRTYSTDNFDLIINKINNIIDGLEHMYGVSITLKISPSYAPVINDTKPYEIIKKVANDENIEYIELTEPYLYGEDFSSFSKISKINYSFLGLRNEEKGYISGLHTPTFNFDENILSTGVNYYLGIMKYYNKKL